ncbi:hypothetical protein AB0H92_01655 [Streptomyces phaeochromogenes]|uniref:Uncharacterized protein n=1 Tax=Streptomyces phaeochromogenes TaxID=1923 RepID=A0ABZ1H5U2_STRPH|nr:hypothetical protein [Streptomyces phaeochromogenes]MCX5603146.1 hypothetical protein [Streptomyces phaeochromogenes]WRZ27429.1 hypothetical protein OG931_06580 [Streptomyces phaeochromogenes]WSD12993.1 hypothetical protein OHB35_06980 [Streptomyces phaeochromogenes]WSJ10212.1 hypothetical protein OG437_44575 [Streptomyces phaeochromogenes]WSS91743.1 hypothetical protein OG478_08180 [Streptomyces phaeochromogenes]
MEQSEIILRAIGVLTETQEMVRRLNEDVEVDIDAGEAQLGRLVTEVFPSVEVPGDATPAEAGQAVIDALMPAAISLVGAFAFLFSELAEVHDTGRTEIKSTELLRTLALRLSNSDSHTHTDDDDSDDDA